MNFRTKLTLVLLLISMMPLVVMSGFLLLSNKVQLERSGAVVQWQAELTRTVVEHDLELALAEVRSWATGKNLSAALIRARGMSKAELLQRWQSGAYTGSDAAGVLSELRAISMGRFAEVFITDSRGYVVASTNPTNDFDQGPEEDPPAGEPWWAAARSSGSHIGTLEMDQSAGVYAIDISLALMQDDQFIGVIKAVYNVEKMLEVFGQSNVGRSGHAVLIDAAGTVIAAPPRFATIIQSPRLSVSRLHVFTLAQARRAGFTLEDIPWTGQSIVGVAPGLGADALSRDGWAALVILPVEEALFSARRFAQWSLVVLIAVAVAVLLASMRLSAGLSRPLREITKVVAEIDGGKLDAVVPYEGDDEVGVLASSVNHMTQRLARYDAMNIEKIQQLNAELAVANSRLEHWATRDSLTGLWNVRIFHERLIEALQLAARNGLPLSMVMLDLDHFKRVNDRYGHQAGDAVLQAVAKVLQTTSRRTDLAARYGGEEMTLILPDTDGAGALNVAEKLRQTIESEIIEFAGEKLQITASFGVASTCAPARCSADELIAAADAAMYTAKKAGRNCVKPAAICTES